MRWHAYTMDAKFKLYPIADGGDMIEALRNLSTHWKEVITKDDFIVFIDTYWTTAGANIWLFVKED